ncbi:MAG: hypothetical protein CO035_01890 [Candidatus Omnitrophica bacterium CG_4_9_14_0_2_um_filter_42_8]|nr:MAG: hypothetical protein CO035_01890 [Candidatus Omnitrophica bacterium CG_4_9_14_0_2_um_filter_42_8]
MNIYAIPSILAAFLGYTAAYFIYSTNKSSKANLVFALDWLSASTWFLGYAFMYSVKDENLALFWAKFTYIGVVFIPVFAYHFILIFLGVKNKKAITIIIYLAAFIFMSLIFLNKDFISGTYKYFWGYQTKVGYLHNVFLVFFSLVFLGCFYNLFKHYFKKKNKFPIEATRIKYIFLAYLIACLGALDFIPNYGYEYYPFCFLFVIVALGIVTYAIVRYRLMNVNIAITRAGIFTFVYTLVLVIPFIVGGVIKSHITNTLSNWWIIPLLIGVILASGGPFIYMRLQKKFESRLRAQEFKSHEALRRLSHNMLRFTNLNVLLRLMVHYLVKVLKLRFTAIYLFDRQSEKYILSSSWHSGENVELPQEFEANNYLVGYMHLKKLPVVTEELSLYAPTALMPKIKKLFSDLSALRINTVIPSFLRNGLIGFLILSDRRKKNIPFTQEDLNLLMVLSNEAALAIENAQFHQREVSTLVEKSKREALADMAPGASHQFNNRLASISSSVELLLFKMESFNIEAHHDERTKALLKDAKEALELIDSEVYKGKEITSAILKRAKAKVEFQEFNLPTLIENTYKLVMISRSRSGLDRAKELKFNIACSDKIPDIFASEALLQDVFYNLIDNAYDAIQDKAKIMSQEGNPLFQGEIEVALSQEDNLIVAKVRDNGIGLTKENHRKLFTPYFTTKATSNKGTGLGLCVIRDFIEMHKGTISCDSEYNKGAAFTIRLPIKREKTHGN